MSSDASIVCNPSTRFSSRKQILLLLNSYTTPAPRASRPVAPQSALINPPTRPTKVDLITRRTARTRGRARVLTVRAVRNGVSEVVIKRPGWILDEELLRAQSQGPSKPANTKGLAGSLETAVSLEGWCWGLLTDTLLQLVYWKLANGYWVN